MMIFCEKLKKLQVFVNIDRNDGLLSQIKTVLRLETMLNRHAAQFAIERSGRERQACLAARVMAVCRFDISFSSFFLASYRFSVLR